MPTADGWVAFSKPAIIDLPHGGPGRAE